MEKTDTVRDVKLDYDFGKQIGSGSFAVVWKATRRADGGIVAIKEINTEKLNAKLRESLESEIAILQRTHHPNIIRLHDLRRSVGRVYLVMEYCGGGDLAQYIGKNGTVKEERARALMHQLAAGLKVLRAHNLIHRDLKPQNLLLTAGAVESATLKIADFGFARSMEPQDLAETLCGSPLYMAPEILQFQKYDAKADLWSVGTILFELLVGRPPFGGANHMALLRNIERTDEAVPPDVVAAHSAPCVHLLRCLLRRNPIRRVSFEEFFLHPFMLPATTASPSLPDAASSASLAPPSSFSGRDERDSERERGGDVVLRAGCAPHAPSYLGALCAGGAGDSGTMSTASHSATQSGGGESSGTGGTGGSGAVSRSHTAAAQYDSYTEQQDSLCFHFDSDSTHTSPVKPPPPPLHDIAEMQMPRTLFPAVDLPPPESSTTGRELIPMQSQPLRDAPVSSGFQMHPSLPMAQSTFQVRRLVADEMLGEGVVPLRDDVYGSSAPANAAIHTLRLRECAGPSLATLPHAPSVDSLAEIEDGYVMIDSEFDGLGGSRDGRRGGGGSGGGGIGGGREGSGGMRRAGGDNRGGADEIRAVEATLAMQMPHTGRAWESSERERQRRSESSEVTDLTHSMAMMGSSPPPQFFMRTEGDGVFPTYSCSAPSAREWQSPGSGGGGAGVMGGELYPGGLGLGRVPPQSSAPPQPIFSPAEAVGLPRTAAAAEAAPADTIEHAGALRCCATLLEQLSATHGDAGRLQAALSMQLLALETLAVSLQGGGEESARRFRDGVARAETLAESTLMVGSVSEESFEGFDGLDADVPDAIELTFQGMLVLGRAGAVDELMGNFDAAVTAYGSASVLLYFLMVEAPNLSALMPPLVMRSMDRLRLRRYASSIAARYAVVATPSTRDRAPPAFGSSGNLQRLQVPLH